MKGVMVPGVLPAKPAGRPSKIGWPGKRKLLKSPVSPGKWPVAVAAALGVVKVGNTAWLFAKYTPRERSAVMAGASVELTASARRPSITTMTTLCRGRACAAGPGRSALPQRTIAPSRTDTTGRARMGTPPRGSLAAARDVTMSGPLRLDHAAGPGGDPIRKIT